MAYDDALAARIRAALGKRPGLTEKAMFGGIAWLLDGKMFVGIVKDELMARVGPDGHDAALREPGARTMDFTGKPMRGYVFVAQSGLPDTPTLRRWCDRAAAFVATLPAKAGKRAKPTSAKIRKAGRRA